MGCADDVRAGGGVVVAHILFELWARSPMSTTVVCRWWSLGFPKVYVKYPV